MQNVFVQLVTEEDRVRGFATLAKRARISSLPRQVYQISIEGLQLLESEHINYRRATDAEVKAANDQVRNPANRLLGQTANSKRVSSTIQSGIATGSGQRKNVHSI